MVTIYCTYDTPRHYALLELKWEREGMRMSKAIPGHLWLWDQSHTQTP